MSEPIGMLVRESCLGLLYDFTTRELTAMLPSGNAYKLKTWKIRLVDEQGNITELTRATPHREAGKEEL